MKALRDLLENYALSLLLIAIACLSVWDERSERPKDIP